ncbi:S8 family serine peptidase, partial [Endozoicomonas sp. SESOKO1]|uniref:S8 family serine peptidase n=1 Tax=Endozoicomonas sp. SESOKO1 TaxID=2828742 RepID=UPI0021489EBE
MTLTALGLLFSTQQLAHASERKQLYLQKDPQSRNISRPPECDIEPWLTSPPINVGNASPVTDVSLRRNNNHFVLTYPDSDESGQADTDDILPDLKHLFDQTFNHVISSATHDKGPHIKPNHHKNPKEHNARTGRLQQLSSQPLPQISPFPPPHLPQCNFTTSEYTSQNTLIASALDLLTTRQPSPIVVAVIDSGIIPHRALNDQLVPGYDFISDPECAADGDGYDDTPTDEGDFSQGPPWHGTEMAGIIAGTSVNKDGISPLQNIIKIQPIRALGQRSHCNKAETDEDFINALKWAAGMQVADVPLNTNPAKVINLSFGKYSDCAPFETVFKALHQREITVVAAAGNSAMPASYFYFSNCPHVIAVGAQLTESLLTSSSNYGPPIAISAIVGEGVTTTSNTGKATPLAETSTKSNGTSTAAALVSQAAALMHSVNSRLTPDDIRTILINTSRPFQPHVGCYIADSITTDTESPAFLTIGIPKPCTYADCGSGHLDIGKAVMFAAEKALEQSGSEFQADDFPTIMFNGSLIIILSTLTFAFLLVNGPKERLQTIAYGPRQMFRPAEAGEGEGEGDEEATGNSLTLPALSHPKGIKARVLDRSRTFLFHSSLPG